MSALKQAKRALQALGKEDLIFSHHGGVQARPEAYVRLAAFFEAYAAKDFDRGVDCGVAMMGGLIAMAQSIKEKYLCRYCDSWVGSSYRSCQCENDE